MKNYHTNFFLIFFLQFTLYAGTVTYVSAAEYAFKNKIDMKFISVPKGSFLMGSPGSEFGHRWDEKRHKVIITNNFYISATEVTQQQWEALMEENPSSFVACGPDCPVENVSWNDCQRFIKKLNRMEKTSKYRLPTEAEWEYACRAGSSKAIANGDIKLHNCKTDPNLDTLAWYCGNSGNSHPMGNTSTQTVETKEPNAWGIFGMHGNVQEWCLDSCKWRDLLRGKVGVITDTYVEEIRDPLNKRGDRKIFRGGSYESSARMCRSARRYYYRPGMRLSTLGFRVVKMR